MSVYDFYGLSLHAQKPRLFISQTYIYGGIAISSLAVFTNILVAATFIVTWKFWRNSTGILLLTLACVDIIGNGFSLIYRFIELNPFIFFEPKTFYYLIYVFIRLSFLMMIPISANRYALICRPFTHRRITSQKSALIQITTLIVFAATTQIYEFDPTDMNNFIYAACRFVFLGIMSVILPVTVSFVLTILVIREFRRMNRTLADSRNSGTVSRHGEKNVTKTMIAVNVAFIVLILPGMLMEILYSFIPMCTSSPSCDVALICLQIISYINYCVNIFIYTSYLPKFRSTLFGYFKCKCCKRRENESTVMSRF